MKLEEALPEIRKGRRFKVPNGISWYKIHKGTLHIMDRESDYVRFEDFINMDITLEPVPEPKPDNKALMLFKNRVNILKHAIQELEAVVAEIDEAP
jgi:hypothetical protein